MLKMYLSQDISLLYLVHPADTIEKDKKKPCRTNLGMTVIYVSLESEELYINHKNVSDLKQMLITVAFLCGTHTQLPMHTCIKFLWPHLYLL